MNRIITIIMISTLIFFRLNTILFGLEDSNGITIRQALDQKRLIGVYNNPNMIGTGGPRVPLPDGSFVNRDTIVEAIQPLIRQGYSICPDLVKALKDEHIHLRYGAYLTLTLITKSELAYYPFLPPTYSENLKAFEEWNNFIKKGRLQGKPE